MPIIVDHSCKNEPLGLEKKLETFRAMAKASLDTCLSSSSSPKLISIKRSKGTCGTEVSLYTRQRSDLVTNARLFDFL